MDIFSFCSSHRIVRDLAGRRENHEEPATRQSSVVAGIDHSSPAYAGFRGIDLGRMAATLDRQVSDPPSRRVGGCASANSCSLTRGVEVGSATTGRTINDLGRRQHHHGQALTWLVMQRSRHKRRWSASLFNIFAGHLLCASIKVVLLLHGC